MSIYGHYTQQYYGNKISFPEQSFLIAGISFYKNNCSYITYETELTMEFEPDNKYDKSAISIKNNNKKIGYVPNSQIKELCKKYNRTIEINKYKTYSWKLWNSCYT